MWKEIFQEKEAVLFDLDGTVIDSMWIWRQIDMDYFARYALDMPDTYQQEIEGLSFYETAKYTQENYINWISVETMMKEWNDMAYEHYAHIVKPKASVVQFLEYLKNTGHKLGIVTSNSRILCHVTLKNNRIFNFFDSIITSEDCTAGKPAPDVYLMSAEALNVSCDKCIVFEDLCNGIIAGKNAGMATVAVHDDYSLYQWDMKRGMADYSIMSYKEIADEVC
ncbi:MAG: HAD family phosphatase [Lachnospiraceae bacterium]|nr:HAD family phosphatase [Lachnospiraceae bacterium]